MYIRGHMLKRPKGKPGTLVVLEHVSRILKDNPSRDPHVRKARRVAAAAVRRLGQQARFPVLYDLVGFTGSGLAHANWKPFGDNVPERAARLIHEKKMGPAIIVFPGLLHRARRQPVRELLGDRPNYADYLTREIIPFVDREFRTLAAREHRGCFGKSSGGYGAMIHGMQYAKYWGAIANHSGDACFDFVYRCDWPNTLNELGKHRVPERKAGRLRRAARGAPHGARARTTGASGASSARVEAGEALGQGRPRDHEPLHGGDLRPRPARAARLRLPFNARDRRADRGALAHWLKHDPCGWSALREAACDAARHLHRLRLARPVPHPLRHAQLSRRLAAAGVGTATKSSTTITPTSTTAWTRACRFSRARCASLTPRGDSARGTVARARRSRSRIRALARLC
jgi:hypothetical protein